MVKRKSVSLLFCHTTYFFAGLACVALLFFNVKFFGQTRTLRRSFTTSKYFAISDLQIIFLTQFVGIFIMT